MAGLFGGTILTADRITTAGLSQYVQSIAHYLESAKKLKVDVEIQNHPIFDMTPDRLVRLKTRARASHTRSWSAPIATRRSGRSWSLECIQSEIRSSRPVRGARSTNRHSSDQKVDALHALKSRRWLLQALAATLLNGGRVAGQTRVHRKPKPLPAGAVTHDWRAFLGPSHNGVSTETKLSRTLPPPLVWECPKGTGYASPAIAGDRLVFLHRLANEEIVECLHPELGRHPLAIPIRHCVRGSVRLQQRSPVEPGDCRRPCLHHRSRRPAALPGSGIWAARVAAGSAGRVPRAPGFFRDGIDAAGGRPIVDRQRRRAGRAVRGGDGPADGPGRVARRPSMGSKLRVSRSRRGSRTNGGCSCLRAANPIRRRAG